MPWNLLALDPHRVWTVSHAHGKADWWIECDRVKDNHFCWGCHFWSNQVGGPRVAELYDSLTPAQVARKDANTGYARGISCDVTDAFYIPGVLSAEFRDLALLFGQHLVEVELAFTTIIDSIALREDTEIFNHIYGKNSIDATTGKFDILRTVGFIHPFKWSKERDRQVADFARVKSEALFTAPNFTWLRTRPEVHLGFLG